MSWVHRVGWRIAVALVACLILTGCAHAPTTGHMDGSVYRVGGPMQPSGGSPPAQPLQATVVVTSTTDATKTWSTRTAADGSFAFDLPPGTYGVVAETDGSAAISGQHEVTVVPGETVNVDCVFYVP